MGSRVLKLIFSVFIFLAGLELSLQFAHWLHGALQPAPALIHPGAPVILCVGDSHTYGVKVADRESYPGQLQALLDRNRILANVINAGIPGQNTSELRRALPALLDRYHPSVVVILSCANNEWNRHETTWSDLEDQVLPSGPGSWPARAWYGGIGSLRTVRLIAYTWNETGRRLHPLERTVDRDGRVYFHEWRGKGEWDPPRRVYERTLRDLYRIIDLVSARGGEAILMTYAGQPFSPMVMANQMLREAASGRGVPLVDNDAVIRGLYLDPGGKVIPEVHDRLFLSDPGETHLAGPGYAVVAEDVYRSLLRTGAVKE